MNAVKHGQACSCDPVSKLHNTGHFVQRCNHPTSSCTGLLDCPYCCTRITVLHLRSRKSGNDLLKTSTKQNRHCRSIVKRDLEQVVLEVGYDEKVVRM